MMPLPKGKLSSALLSSKRWLMGLNLILLAGVLWVAASGFSTFVEMVRGPQVMQAADLTNFQATPDSMARTYVTLKGVKLIDTGATEISVRKKRGVERGRSETAHYYAMPVGSTSFLMVRGTMEEHGGSEITGWLKSPERAVDQSTLNQLNAGPADKRMISGMLLDETDTKEFEWILALACLVGFALAVWNLSKVWRRTQQIHHYPVMRSLGDGSEQQAMQALSLVNEDLDIADSSLSKSVHTGQRYALQQQRYKVDLLDMQEAAWIYKKVVNKKIYYVIPAGTSNSVQVHTLSEQSQEWHFGGKADLAEQFLIKLAQASPWAVIGYDVQIKKVWDKGRKNFIAQVLARKQELANPVSPASSPATAA